MKINLIIIFFRILTRHETFILVWIGFHKSGSYRFLDFIIKFFYRFDTYLIRIIFCTPDRQWSTPITRTAKVPVIQIFQPLAETAGSGRFRFPVDGFIQFHHSLLASGRTDKPAIQWIIKHRFVCTPAVRIVVDMLFYLESLVVCFHHHGNDNIQRFGSLRSFLIVFAIHHKLRIISIFHPCTLIFFVFIYINTFFYEILIQLIQQIEFTS